MDRVQLELDQNKIKFDDQATWDLIGRGDTIGVFQLESRIGRRYAKQARPASIDELSDVIAIIRPGCLQSRLEDGRSLTDHYIARKSLGEEIEYPHPALESILESTVGIMVYQESAIQIGRELAGMTDAQADLYLRYAIGKKKAKLIEEGKVIFLEGCDKNNIPKKDAELIFSWIEGCARYSFNKCLSPNSVVYTPDGMKLLDEISIGDTVLAPSDNGDEFVEVLDFIECGDKEVYEIELEDGNKLTCTMDHKLLCSDGIKRPLSQIIEEDLDVLVYDH